MTLPTAVNVGSRSDVVLPAARLRELDAVFDPPFDVDPSVADVSAGSEADGALSSVPPRVEGLDWDVEEVGEFFCGEKPVVAVHGRIMRDNPLIRVSFRRHFDVLFFRV